jgi:membrane-associated phospholipid phosphatase
MLRRISFVFLLLFSLAVWADGVQGLTYYTYQSTSGASPSINPLVYPTVRSTGISPSINYPTGSFNGVNILGSGYGDRVIVKWVGYINIPTAGTYYFGANADDGFKILINNTLVTDSWIDSGGAFRSGAATTLSAGAHALTFWYYENGGGQMVIFQYSTNNTNWTVVPTTMLATDSTYWAPAAPQYSSGITGAQQTSKTTNTNLRQSQQGNLVDIEQIGDNNTITIRQGSSSSGKNRMEVYANGNSNSLNLNQGYNSTGTVDGVDTNNHYQMLHLSGNSNSVTTVQKDSGTGVGQYMETTVSGNNNVIDLKQSNASNKTMFTNVNGSNNTVGATQKDGGSHYLDIRLQGNGHTVTAVQEGSGNHAATINLTNGGGASNLNLNQLGSTSQTYSITESCVNPAGCNTTIIQGQ